MELKLSDTSKDFLKKIDEIPSTWCDGKNNCMDAAITKAFMELEPHFANYSFMKQEYKFLLGVSIVQTDGRSCPGDDRQNKLRKLLDTSWRRDFSIVVTGLRTGSITLNSDDIIKLA